MCSPATRARITRIASSSVAIVVGGLPRTRRAESPRPMPRSIRPPLSSSRVARADAVTLGSRVPGFVTHVPRRSASLASAISVSSGYGSRQSTCESNSQPAVNPAASAWRVRARVRSIVCSGLSVKPNCMGRFLDGASRRLRLRSDEVLVRVGPSIPVELPGLANLGDQVEVHVPDDQLLVVGRAQLADELAAGRDEVALAVEVVVAQVLFDPDPVDRPHEVAVRDRVADLLDPPQVLAQAARRGTRDEDHLRPVQAERPGALREVAAVADVHADLADGRL